MPHCHLILGGARSGKSTFAEQTALSVYSERQHTTRSVATLIYLATATAGDHEMADRIAQHQVRRGPEWLVVEEPLELGTIIAQASSDTTILVDCLTLWLSNCLHQQCWVTQRDSLLEALKSTAANVIMVSNEVGSGIVPMGELSRQFVDESGWLHQQIASIANNVSLIIAGLETPLKTTLR